MTSLARGNRRWKTIGVLGFIGILGAGFNGGSFLNYSEDVSSMLIATGFALATIAYVTGLFMLPRNAVVCEAGHTGSPESRQPGSAPTSSSGLPA